MSEKNTLLIALALVAGYIVFKKGKKYSNISSEYVPNRAPAPEEGGEVNSGPIPEDYKSKKNDFYENLKTGTILTGAVVGATAGGIYLYKKGHLRTAGTKLKEGYEYAKTIPVKEKLSEGYSYVKTGVKNILQARKEQESGLVEEKKEN